jgi:oligoribonuclease
MNPRARPPASSPPEDGRLVWIDLEMTGLRPDADVILEIATVVTDKDLAILAEGPVLAIRQDPDVLAAMDAWNQTHHRASGLVERVLASSVDTAQAERLTLEFLSRHVLPGSSPMCGNSICQDRRFLARRMPDLERFFHYRNLDVSTLKELARRWSPEILAGFQKESRHTALSDVYDSIEELRYYRRAVWRSPP